MQNVPLDVLAEVVPTTSNRTAEIEEEAPESAAARWVNRITGIVGAVFLLLALTAWFARHGHYRLVLALLIVALFASILHAYTFDNGHW